MGAKSRGNWSVGMCLKDCSHQGCDDICGSCIRFSNLNSSKPEVFDKVDMPKYQGTYGKPSMRFYPHYNSAMGKYISTKGEYLSEMKKGGYEPYTGEAKPHERQKPDTSGTNRLLRAIHNCSNRDGSFTPSGNLKSELMKRGVIMKQSDIHKYHEKVREMTHG